MVLLSPEYVVAYFLHSYTFAHGLMEFMMAAPQASSGKKSYRGGNETILEEISQTALQKKNNEMWGSLALL